MVQDKAICLQWRTSRKSYMVYRTAPHIFCLCVVVPVMRKRVKTSNTFHECTQLTEIRRSWHCKNVLVADGDSWKTHLLLVFDTYIDVCWMREIVRHSTQDLICGKGCSGEQQQDPDRPSERWCWRVGDVAKSNNWRLTTERLQFHASEQNLLSSISHDTFPAVFAVDPPILLEVTSAILTTPFYVR